MVKRVGNSSKNLFYLIHLCQGLIQGKLTVDLSKFASPVKTNWFNPVDGNLIPIASELTNKGTYDFSPPGLIPGAHRIYCGFWSRIE